MDAIFKTGFIVTTNYESTSRSLKVDAYDGLREWLKRLLKGDFTA